ncbi:FtsX-like permease family protein [Streptomyces sp. NPDC059783]|uniref:FtsX-like permease family protein n=1 Tax=Streptomyces sp. NPDC059783 TaxID=3346944 RepID=UPI003658104E
MPVSLVALQQMRGRPAAFVGLGAALLLAVATTTLFGSLLAAELTAPDGSGARTDGPGVAVIAGAFGEIAVLVSLFVVVNALGFAVERQHRELALLRTVAATPRQVRRLVRVQVVAAVLLVSGPGWVLGTVAARGLLAALQRRGMASPDLSVTPAVLPMLVATAAALVVGTAATAVAARRISRIPPAAALTASATEQARTGVPRLLVGLVAVAGGALLLRLAATRPAQDLDKAGQAALLGSLALLVALALTGPLTARLPAAVLGAPLRVLSPGTGWLADAHLRGYARRLSSAVVPVALLVGLSGTMTAMTHTAKRASDADTGSVTSATDVWLRQGELAMLMCFAAVSTVNTLVAVTADRRREFALLRLAGATRPQVMRMLAAEAAVTTVVGVLLGGAVAAAATAAYGTAVTGSALPSVPEAACGWIVAGAAVLTLPGILASGAWAVRGPAADVAGGDRG